LATVKEEEKKVSYHIITGELRDKIGTALRKNPWDQVDQLMDILKNLPSVQIEKNEASQKELPFEEKEGK